MELEDRKLRIEDAKNATFAAMKALLAHAKLIASNVGADGDMIVEKVMAHDWQIGYKYNDQRV